MRLGVHLPLADLGDGVPTADDLRDYAVAARELGFSTVAANDHLVWSHPWLDGPTALASVAGSAGEMALATSITLPVVRHPVGRRQDADHPGEPGREGRSSAGSAPGPAGPTTRRSGSRSRSGGPGSTRRCRLVRALVRGEPDDARDVLRRRVPAGPDTRPVPRGLVRQLGVRSTARRDGGSGGRLVRLGVQRDAGAVRTRPAPGSTTTCGLQVGSRTPSPMPSPPCGCSSPTAAVRRSTCSPRFWRRRSTGTPGSCRHLPIGSAQHCAEVLAAYAAAGAREVLVWPMRDPLRPARAVAAAASTSPRSHAQGRWVVGPHSSPMTRPSMVCFCTIGVSSSTTGSAGGPDRRGQRVRRRG